MHTVCIQCNVDSHRTLYAVVNTFGPPDLCLCTKMAVKDILNKFSVLHYILRTSTPLSTFLCLWL